MPDKADVWLGGIAGAIVGYTLGSVCEHVKAVDCVDLLRTARTTADTLAVVVKDGDCRLYIKGTPE